MQQAKIYWDLENYSQVEKIFRKSVEFCNDQDVWKLNVAHVLFMQENKFKEAAGFYEPIVKKHYDNVGQMLLSFVIFHLHFISFSPLSYIELKYCLYQWIAYRLRLHIYVAYAAGGCSYCILASYICK